MMQVFLPYPDFRESVACLDKSRLGNQIWRECKTILNGGWKNHPVSKMWADYKPALARYGLLGVKQLNSRQALDPETSERLKIYFYKFLGDLSNHKYETPPFIGNSEFHLSHRLNLLWKDPEWYSQFFDEPIPTSKPSYYWPSPQKIGTGTGSEQ